METTQLFLVLDNNTHDILLNPNKEVTTHTLGYRHPELAKDLLQKARPVQLLCLSLMGKSYKKRIHLNLSCENTLTDSCAYKYS